VVVQSETQRRMLKERTGREGLLIRNPVDLTPITRRFPGLPFDRYALWVGRADRHHKRPLACVEAARAAPEVKIVMVMNPGKEAVSEEVRRGLPSNVHLIDRVDFQEIGPLYAGADLFLSTSVFEGVPNAVLMAGAQGVPLVSFEIDPGGLAAASGGGVVCGGEMGRFVRELRRLWADGEDRRRLGDLLREHVRREHDLQRQVETLAKALRELCAAQGPRPLGAARPGA
jgi:glycosyltransferase involved in cell wall biosynthesis